MDGREHPIQHDAPNIVLNYGTEFNPSQHVQIDTENAISFLCLCEQMLVSADVSQTIIVPVGKSKIQQPLYISTELLTVICVVWLNNRREDVQ